MPQKTKPKDARLDLRMTAEQKHQIETAAAINGLSVSQWSLDQLMNSARTQIEEQGIMKLAAESFSEFERLLEEPAPSEFEGFASGKTRWDK
ncbi:MAG: DUF1778 domain-containing protein [Coriobacteriales bacterium]|jgi:uncharacterized protein (DUF1778 family)